MKKIVKKILPIAAVTLIKKYYFQFLDNHNRNKTPREVFAAIYRSKKWGSDNHRFCSGPGSRNARIVEPYVDVVRAFLKSLNTAPVVVDLGCGDFYIGRKFLPYCSRYVAVDVVPELIDENKSRNFGTNVDFVCLDITREDLPDGDVCFVRQVFQHLSNEQINRILQKLKKYKVVFVTEHHPTDNPSLVVNKDMVHGERTRLQENSGIFLDRPPFNLDGTKMKLVLEVPGTENGNDFDNGVIRTFKIDLQRS